jgi:hypothetical protein
VHDTNFEHASIKITERQSPWVKARQEQIEADVQRIWAADAAQA